MKQAANFGIISLVSILLFGSCEIINPPEKIPSYIRIDTFKVVVNEFDRGTATHMMTDIWMSVGGTNMGVYTMPFTIPTLETGLQTITIRPGIKLNGISASRIAYPFYEPVIIDLELHEKEIHLLEPVSTYKDVCKFPWIEEFEDPGVSFLYPVYSDTTIINQRNVVREGNYSGAIFLTKDAADFEAYFDDDIELPQNATPVLLEFDYKNTNGFEVGMYLIEDGMMEWNSLVYIKPSERWKRFYVDLGTKATYASTTELFRIVIRAAFELEDEETANIYLDNVKLIHY
ncbi:MAG: hypothetical protein HN352_16540 [Bacteroidetes bacterium]|nr:hypothetical protein [Bacteroidota bacterium]MBT3748788.1 hypothetical protein [Bacteroidota bacterium]MBT4400837.1 hypothetical protein [Bacteroidota bacterium]MBT4411860.1 hypothetical protein [Bacteroidota bacterium]MBT7466356.1 hypothetical protein [Bacteroidota bacterium]